jgi:serine/threonine protein phosphatase PrpC
MEPGPRCPNPECREVVQPGDHYCEVCGQAIRTSQPARVDEGAEVAVLPAAAAAAPSRNGGARQVEPTRGPSRARDHVEVALPVVGGVSDRGLIRARNEDAVAIGWVAEQRAAIMIVCDGVSSSESAARASQVAAEAALASLTITLQAGEPALEAAMNDAVAAAQDAVAAIPHLPGAAKDPPSSTLVAAVVADGQVTLGWLGDSRAYFVGAAGTWQLSQDDTWAAEQVAQGRLSESEAASDPRGHFLTRWLGEDRESREGPSVRTFEVDWPGFVVLCSDGLWNYLPSTDRLGELLLELPEDSEPVSRARSLTDFAREAGGRDNITVAVAVVDGTRPGEAPC